MAIKSADTMYVERLYNAGFAVVCIMNYLRYTIDRSGFILGT